MRWQRSGGSGITPGAACVGAIMKQERPYILEWVAWHRLLGFDIIIADNGGTDGQTGLLLRLADAGAITYLDVRHFKRAPQTFAYFAMLRRAHRAGAAYLGFLDADEFFEPLGAAIEAGAGSATISRLFARTNAAALAFNWMTFGSSGLASETPAPVMARFTRSAPQDFPVNHHVKSFFDVPRATRTFGSHLFGNLMLHAHGPKIDASYYSHDGSAMEFSGDRFGITKNVSWTNARIRHYVVKTPAEFNRKAARGSTSLTATYDPTFFAHHDRNDIDTPMDASALALLAATTREIENRLAGARTTTRRNLLEAARVTWDARPTLRPWLDKLGRLARAP